MRRLAWVACFALGAAAACRKDAPPPPETTAAPPRAPAPSASAPADHLAPGELIEGKEKMFALILPRDMKVAWAFPDVAMAKGDVEPELVANYVRARVAGGKMTVGASQTVFEGVRIKADPGKELRIKVEKFRGMCQLEIRDITPGPPEPDPGDDAARWRKAGFAPDGRLLDPLHTQ